MINSEMWLTMQFPQQQCQSTKQLKYDVRLMVDGTVVPRFVAAFRESRVTSAMFLLRHRRLYFAISIYQLGRREVALRRCSQQSPNWSILWNLSISQGDHKFCCCLLSYDTVYYCRNVAIFQKIMRPLSLPSYMTTMMNKRTLNIDTIFPD